MLVAKYHDSNCQDKTILADINKSIDSSVQLRSKKHLSKDLLPKMTVQTDVGQDWKEFVKSRRRKS